MKNFIVKKFLSPAQLFRAVIVCTILFINNLFTYSVTAQSRLNGVFQNYNAIQTISPNTIIAGRNRLNFQFNQSKSYGGVFAESDIIQHYGEIQSVELQLKELYADLYFDQSDLRIGSQKIIWGRSDAGFVSDILSPVDLRDFFTQDPDDIRAGLVALNYTRYFDQNSLQLILAPFFQPYQIPDSESRWFPVQELSLPIPISFESYGRNSGAGPIQIALRYGFRASSVIDLDLYTMAWTYPLPAYGISFEIMSFPTIASVQLTESYKRSVMGGFSTSIQFHSMFRFISEVHYVKNRLFTYVPVSAELLETVFTNPTSTLQFFQQFEIRNDNYLVSHPWVHSMVGVQTELFGAIIRAQGYLETIINYDKQILQDQNYSYLSLLVNKSFSRDRLQTIFLGRYNFNANDYWVQLQGVYEFDDGLEFSTGLNLFGGQPIDELYGHFSFKRFQENSFLFSKIAVYF